MAGRRLKRKLAAILAADVAGYSRLMGADEEGTLAHLKAIRSELIDPKVAEYGGRVFKTTGDGLLIEFPSAVEAVRFAIDAQRAMVERNADVPSDRRIEFRIGINLGDVIVEHDDLYGDGVNVAARIEALAEPGGLCVSRSVRDQIRDKLDYCLVDLGDIEVKNIVRPVRIFRVGLGGDLVPSAAPGRHASAGFGQESIGRIAGALLIASAVVVGVDWWRPWVPAPEQNPAERTAPLSRPDKPSVAVLPFDNVSDDQKQDYFAVGLTDDLITDLSKISGLFVIARNSVFAFKGSNVRIEDVARELGVTYVIEGSVRRSGDRIRVNAQLVDVGTGRHLWAERYDRNITDIFAVQDDLVSRIVSALAVRLTRTEELKLARRPAPEFRAYDLYLQARDGFFSRDQVRMRDSLVWISQTK